MRSNLFQNRLSILSILPLLFLSILISSTSTSALTSAAAQSGQLDFHLQRIGVPITDHARIEPRFHRIQRQGQDPNDREGHKGQTAIYTAGRANGGVTTIAAINPRNGGVVWRQVLEPTDPIKAFFTTADVILTLSGPTASNVRLHHALTGYLLWEAPPTKSTLNLIQASKQVDDSESSLDLGFDAHFMKGVGDILVISDNGKLLRRLEAKTGREIFNYSLEIDQAGGEGEEQLIRVVSSHSNIFLISIKKVKVGLISKETQYVLTSHVLTLGGKHLKSFNLPAQILGGASDVVLTPLSASSQYLTPPSQDGTSSSMIPPLVPHLSWLQKDGSIHFLPLYYNENLSENDIKDKVQIIKSKESDTRFFKIKEIVGAAHHRGLTVGLRNDGRAEFIKISNLPKSLKDYESTIKSVFASEEEAFDAIHSGFTDKKNQAFICRVFFTRNQQLLNFHIFWVDASNGEGQVSGYSFQWDHDLNGNIQSVSFEVSMMSPYQLVNRASLVTSSGSLRMIQEDQHQWILEESLSQVKKNLMIDLPEKKLIGGGNGLDSNATSASSSTAKNSQINALGNEGPVGRILRHISYLSEVPSYLISNAAKLSSITSYKDIFTVTFSAQRAPAIPSIPGEPAVPLKPPPSAKPKAANRPKSEADISHSSMAPRYTNSSYTTLFRDDFGFRKLLVSATDTGKLYAQDLGARGKFVWEKSLIGFGQGEGSPEPNIKVLDMFMTRSLGDAQELKVESNTLEEVSDPSLINPMKADSNAPIISILAEQSILKAAVVTTVFELDPLTGKFVDDATTGIPLFIGKTQDVFLLPVRDEETGQRVIAAVDKDEKLHIHPSSPSAIKALQTLSPNFYFTLQSTTKTSTSSYSSLTGYSTAGNALTSGNPAIRVWKHDFLPGEKIVDTKDFNRDAIASLGKVRGDRSTLYKYLNVNSKLVTTLISHDNLELDELEATSSLTGYEARIYLIDTISGKILYQTQIEAVDPINGVKTNFVENWITASYSVRNQDEGLSNRLISIELYDSNSDDQTWNWKGFFSSFGKVSSSTSQKSQIERKSKNANPSLSEIEKEELDSLNLPLSFSQTFILPYRVRSLGSTSTKFGITSKSLLVSNDRDQLISIPRRFLDPRRVVGRKQTQLDMEEMLLPYDPLIPNEPKWIVSHFYSVADVQNIVSSPALLESTSLVLGYGLDTFSTRLTPSNTFDLLSENFNKPQLLLTIVALSLGIFLTRPMVKSKILSARWK